MYAWTSINAEDEQVAAHYRDKEEGTNPAAPPLSYDPSYSSDVSRSPPATANYSSYYSEPPKKKVDALAEAWGIHEPEPYEEFFAGGGDDDGPITNSSSMREARPNGRRTREDLTSRPRGSNRIPPPQPIFVGDGQEPEAHSPQLSPTSGGANIGRNKSFISRIRKMRDSPNVPVGFDEAMDVPDGGSSPTDCGGDGFPTHMIILGRFARGGRRDISPADPYAFAEDRAKELPATPTSPMNGYFDAPTSPGLGRKTSILKKVRGVVYRGSK
jgi:hypothetical protein